MSTESSRMRSDARENRARIVAVARELFADRGLDVPMAAVARRAGVGVATLYRRFPTKGSLVTEAFIEQFAVCVSVVDDALSDPDPWRGFCTVISQVCEMQAQDRGFAAAFTAELPDGHIDERTRALRGFAELVQRAKDSGRLRADFAMDDLTLVLMANRGLSAAPAELAPAASRRLVAYLLEAFRAGSNTSLPPPVPLSLDQVLLRR